MMKKILRTILRAIPVVLVLVFCLSVTAMAYSGSESVTLKTTQNEATSGSLSCHHAKVSATNSASSQHMWHVSEKRQKELTSPYYILRREQIDGEAYLRVLSNEEQPGKSIQPTLEDGYINIIRGIR